MPIKKAAIKALRKAKKSAIRNKRIKLELKRIVKKTRLNPIKENLQESVKKLDKAWAKGIIKKNKAARLKSRLLRKARTSIKDQVAE